MELRLDRLLGELRDRPEAILAAIDADPTLLKRQSGDLVLANASQVLYTPAEQHQLYAKGVVYTREPYRLVSLPLVKIYNVGERNVTVGDLAALAGEPGLRLRFLRKMDGSLIQVFRHGGRTYFTTRGMIEGARWRLDDAGEDRKDGFDYVGQARRLAERLYPQLCDDPAALDGRTLLFELIHPKARVVTNYGELTDLFLLAAFDHRRLAYLDHDEVRGLGDAYGLRVVEMLSPAGATLGEQIDELLAAWAGTDEEGCVLSFERPGEVVYRVKVKSPEYLQLMRLMAYCTYDRTIELLDAHPEIRTWDDYERHLQELGRDRVPEEVLGYYREHWERFQKYLADLEVIRRWAEERCAAIDAEIGGKAGRADSEYRKAFAEKAKAEPYSGLLFAARDGRLDVARVRKSVADDKESAEALEEIRAMGHGPDGTRPSGTGLHG